MAGCTVWGILSEERSHLAGAISSLNDAVKTRGIAPDSTLDSIPAIGKTSTAGASASAGLDYCSLDSTKDSCGIWHLTAEILVTLNLSFHYNIIVFDVLPFHNAAYPSHHCLMLPTCILCHPPSPVVTNFCLMSPHPWHPLAPSATCACLLLPAFTASYPPLPFVAHSCFQLPTQTSCHLLSPSVTWPCYLSSSLDFLLPPSPLVACAHLLSSTLTFGHPPIPISHPHLSLHTLGFSSMPPPLITCTHLLSHALTLISYPLLPGLVTHPGLSSLALNFSCPPLPLVSCTHLQSPAVVLGHPPLPLVTWPQF